jgi:hypothetical protein
MKRPPANPGRFNSVDPLAYLTATLTAIVNGHKQSQIDGLLPWNYPARQRNSRH